MSTPNPSAKKHRLTVHLPRSLIERIRHHCVDRKMTVSDALDAAIRLYLRAAAG